MLRLLVPFHNAAPWLPRCLESLRRQSLTAWHCYLADDLSDDGSDRVAQRAFGGDSRFTLIRNNERLYQCGSYQQLLANPNFDPLDICVTVDADDYLPDSDVLRRVLEAYADERIWLTWGNYIRTDGEPGIAAPLEEALEVRRVSWRTSHLRTWRLFLWNQIREEDFLGPDGLPLRVAGDLASMFPMIEMAGNRHIRFLESINYVCNRANPLSNFRLRAAEQLRNAAFLRSKPVYAPLEGPPAPQGCRLIAIGNQTEGASGRTSVQNTSKKRLQSADSD
jgi:glycosyltransferase involved in cell wall biosynthesis